MSDFKPGFRWSRTIPRPLEDGTRKGYIVARLHDINVEHIRTGRLTIELSEERMKLINEWYEIDRERYDKFIETGGWE